MANFKGLLVLATLIFLSSVVSHASANPTKLADTAPGFGVIKMEPVAQDFIVFSQYGDVSPRSGGGLYRFSHADGSLVRISLPVREFETIEDFQVSPDGEYVVYTVGDYNSASDFCEVDFCDSAYRKFFIVSVAEGSPRKLSVNLPTFETLVESSGEATFAISPDSETVYISGYQEGMYSVSADSGLINWTSDGVAELSGSPEGAIIVGSSRRELLFLDLNSGVRSTIAQTLLPSSLISEYMLDLSSRTVGFTADYNADGVFSVYRVDLDGGVPLKLAADAGSRFTVLLHLISDLGLIYSSPSIDLTRRSLYFYGAGASSQSLLTDFDAVFLHGRFAIQIVGEHLVALINSAGVTQLQVYSNAGVLLESGVLPSLDSNERLSIDINQSGLLYGVWEHATDDGILSYSSLDGAATRSVGTGSIFKVRGAKEALDILMFQSSLANGAKGVFKFSTASQTPEMLFQFDPLDRALSVFQVGGKLIYVSRNKAAGQARISSFYEFDTSAAITEFIDLIEPPAFGENELCFPVVSKNGSVALVCL